MGSDMSPPFLAGELTPGTPAAGAWVRTVDYLDREFRNRREGKTLIRFDRPEQYFRYF